MFDKLVDLIVSWIKLFFFVFVIHQDCRAIVLRRGRPVTEDDGKGGRRTKEIQPGFHFKWPFDVDEVFYREVTPAVMTVGPQSLTTKDDRDVVVSLLVTYQIEDVAKTIIECQGHRVAIEDAVYGVTSSFVMKHTWAELRSAVDGAKDIEHEITKAARRRAIKFGVQILDAQFIDLTKSRSVRLIGLSSETHFG